MQPLSLVGTLRSSITSHFRNTKRTSGRDSTQLAAWAWLKGAALMGPTMTGTERTGRLSRGRRWTHCSIVPSFGTGAPFQLHFLCNCPGPTQVRTYIRLAFHLIVYRLPREQMRTLPPGSGNNYGTCNPPTGTVAPTAFHSAPRLPAGSLALVSLPRGPS